MRFAIIFLLTAFTFQVSDIAPVYRPAVVKTCCGRPVCLCKHAKGANCDYRAALARMMKQSVHCHLKAKPVVQPQAKLPHCHMKAKNIPSAEKLVSDYQAEETMSFSKAPCHRSSGKTPAQGVCRDMENFPVAETTAFKQIDFLFPHTLPALPSADSRAFERPPKLIPLFSF